MDPIAVDYPAKAPAAAAAPRVSAPPVKAEAPRPEASAEPGAARTVAAAKEVGWPKKAAAALGLGLTARRLGVTAAAALSLVAGGIAVKVFGPGGSPAEPRPTSPPASLPLAAPVARTVEPPAPEQTLPPAHIERDEPGMTSPKRQPSFEGGPATFAATVPPVLPDPSGTAPSKKVEAPSAEAPSVLPALPSEPLASPSTIGVPSISVAPVVPSPADPAPPDVMPPVPPTISTDAMPTAVPVVPAGGSEPKTPAVPDLPTPSAALPAPPAMPALPSPGSTSPGPLAPSAPPAPPAFPAPTRPLPGTPGAGSTPTPPPVEPPAVTPPASVMPRVMPLPEVNTAPEVKTTPEFKAPEAKTDVPLPGTGSIAPMPSAVGAPKESVRPSPATPGVFPAPAAPGVKSPATVEQAPTTSFDVDLYQPRARDTYETISREYYNDVSYARALTAFNGGRPLQAGRHVEVPPIHVLKNRYPQLLGNAPSAPAGAEWLPAGGTSTGPTANFRVAGSSTFVVPSGGMTMKTIARLTLGTEDRWEEIYNLNPKYSTSFVPAGAEIRLPANAVAPK
jgi:hypothetical protein